LFFAQNLKIIFHPLSLSLSLLSRALALALVKNSLILRQCTHINPTKRRPTFNKCFHFLEQSITATAAAAASERERACDYALKSFCKNS
jgi:hypothetical protein